MVAGMTLTLALAYYEAPRMLEQHLEAFRAYPPGIRLVLVDDGSPRNPADLSGCPIPYEQWRVTEDRMWHQHAARNLAMSRCRGPVMLTDMDHLLAPADAHAALHTRLPIGRALRPRRVWPDGSPRGKVHPNSYLIHAADYWRAGGYDESMCGYYGTDSKLKRQLQKAGVAVQDTEAFALTLYEGIVADACVDMPRKGTELHARNVPELANRCNEREPTPATSRFLFPYEYVAGG